MRNSNALTVIGRFWILAFLCSLPFGLPAVLAGVLTLPFLAFVALLVALFFNGFQWLGHRLLFGGTPDYEAFKSQGKDAWFDHSAPWPFRPDDELVSESHDEPAVRWYCKRCGSEAVNLEAPCWNCGLAWVCPACDAPVESEFAVCGRCGNDPRGEVGTR